MSNIEITAEAMAALKPKLLLALCDDGQKNQTSAECTYSIARRPSKLPLQRCCGHVQEIAVVPVRALAILADVCK